MKICFIDKTEFQYNFNHINQKFIRGAENILINLSKNISNLGHEVVVFNNCDTEYKSPKYSWLNISKTYSNNFFFDIVISNNDTRLLDNISANKKFVISHSIQTIEKFIRKKQLKSYIMNKPIYLLLGAYHESKMSKLFSLFGTRIIDYGLDDILLKTKLDNNIDNKSSMFTSRPDRNLDLLVDVWKENISSSYNDLKLFVTPINSDLSHYGIFNRRLINKTDYIQDLLKCRAVILPGHKAELYCLAASEAQELCIPIVTMGIGSLIERVEHNVTGLIARNKKQFSEFIIDIFLNDDLWSDLRKNLIMRRGKKKLDKCI